MKAITKKKTTVARQRPADKPGRRVLAVINPKGGSGKSTLAFNLAVELSKKYDVTVIDLDYQKSLTLFDYNRRGLGMEPFNLMAVNGVKEFKQFITAATGYIIIDTHAIDSDATHEAMKAADFILSPTNDCYLDLCGLLAFKDILKKVSTRTRRIKAHVIANRIRPNTAGYTTIEKFVNAHDDYFEIFKTQLTERADYRDAFAQGKSVCEIKGRKAAADEFKKLLKEVEAL
ncbi:MAG: CobQ/CobB/MinD/ParA nucleotide binding domain protein [Deltaproteobacteria bacterium ADurb.BinA014]|nr:MAG: CobQ/CobB/MinD/ParA nucleotide binding domain protein [Deltaproteobacteria bacterium ADurb.BinA014]